MAALRTEQLPARPGLDAVYAVSVSALVAVITEMITQTAVLEEQVRLGFGQHPDAEIYASQPGLGPILGARVLAEFGDDPDRYADARARKNYGGMAPITKASGTRRIVLARYARNRHLADTLYLQAFSALTSSAGAAPTTTDTEAVAPLITKPSVRSRTGSSGSSTAASATTPSTTNTPPGQDNKNTSRLLLLDTNDPWDI